MNRELLYLNSGILEHWHDKTFADFTNDAEAKNKVLKYIEKYKDAKKDGVGLFLWGKNGVGKSHLMNVAFMQLIYLKCSVHIMTLSSLITMFTAAWYNNDERERLYGTLLTKDFFGIEEIGKEYKGTELSATVLDSVIKYRLQRKLATWATTNKRPTEITATYTEDIASMMKECTVPVKINGNDFRGNIMKDIKAKYL